MKDVELYKELVSFCNNNKDRIEKKFDRKVEFTEFNERCFQEMYIKIKEESNPIPPKIITVFIKTPYKNGELTVAPRASIT